MNEKLQMIDLNPNNMLEYGVCGYRNIKKEGYPEKIAWMKKRFTEGLKIKIIYSEKDRVQGMIEFIPGEYCWRPVEANQYMFIHCIFVGFKKIYKNRGHGSLLLHECISDAREKRMRGVAVVTRRGPFMASNDLFIKNGFEVVDSASPDFELLVYRFNTKSPVPTFNGNWENRIKSFSKGLTIIRADQCPYTVKNINEICETAKNKYKTNPTVITLRNCKEAQNSPAPFGTFCILYGGAIIAEHPISNTRFMNIMGKIIK